MKIAVIGSGIAGLSTGWYLNRDGHAVTLFEADDRLGGHTATMDVREGERTLAVDTGFIVFNDWTYPLFISLMKTLGVDSQPTRMSFSVSDSGSGIEYAGSSLNTLFAQRRNLLSPRFLGMLRGILRFNREVEQDLARDPRLAQLSLGDYLERSRYPAAFSELYLVPMGAAIWSSRESNMRNMPLGFFVRFFRNHGLLNILNRPRWRVIRGGSRAYIDPMTAGWRDGIRLSTPVLAVRRAAPGDASGTVVVTPTGVENFDQVVFACHSDQALRILGEAATPAERSVLGAIPYERNEVVLHTDSHLLPASRRCWSSWNVSLGQGAEKPRLTYNMNILQNLDARRTYCVTLNQSARIREEHILGRYHYDHPVFDAAATAAQSRWSDISGHDGLWFCGAYWRNGFHEDGVWSARRVAKGIAGLAAAPGGLERCA